MDRVHSQRRITQIAAHLTSVQGLRPALQARCCDCSAGADEATTHHNGAGVDAPPLLGAPTKPRRSAAEATAHNLSLEAHEKTPLMNAKFSWNEHGAPRRTGLRVVSEAQAAQFDDMGFCVLEDAFGGEELAAVVAEIDALEAEMASDGGISTTDEITFCAHLVLRSELCRAFTSRPIFANLCHDLLATDDARLYWDQSVYKKPAPEKIFPFHQDNGCAKILGWQCL